LKLTTPASASEPYTAEAPPVMISTLSISCDGMMLRSGTPVPLAGISRLPSSRTRVDDVPRPRSEMLACPALAGLFDVLVNAGTNCGSVLMAVSTVPDPTRSNSSCVTETIGLAESKSGRAMREPVTTTCSSSSSWAGAMPQASESAAASAIEAGRFTGGLCRRPMDFGMMPSNGFFATSDLSVNAPPCGQGGRRTQALKAPIQTSFCQFF